MSIYAIYLRKSRADVEAEARGEGETLERHRTALHALAARRGLTVVKEYAEIVTGDSIAARPQMQALLEDVKRGVYAGVIVNDVDRLGRGDSIDQEIIKLTFVTGHCLIITPTRDIDPAQPSDEDMLDFSMFFARFEYRKITQRLSVGRTRSVQAGNYISSRIPYGYNKVTAGKHITLVPDPETSEIVRMIFNDYVSGEIGYNGIARKLNDMGLHTTLGNTWTRASVRAILTNPIYTGRLLWGRTATVSTIENGKRKKKQVESQPTIVENAYPAIVSDEVFNRVQNMFEQSRHASSTKTNLHLVNPLAGLVVCSQCGRVMQIRGGHRSKTQDHVLTCLSYGCKTRGTYISIVMEAVLETLNDWCARYNPATVTMPEKPNMDNIIAKQTAQIQSRLAKARELVETGIYTPSEYLAQKNMLEEQLATLHSKSRPVTMTKEEAIAQAVPKIIRVLDVLPHAETMEQKNALLRTVIDHIEYTKLKPAYRGTTPQSLLTLDVFPRIGYNV